MLTVAVILAVTLIATLGLLGCVIVGGNEQRARIVRQRNEARRSAALYLRQRNDALATLGDARIIVHPDGVVTTAPGVRTDETDREWLRTLASGTRVPMQRSATPIHDEVAVQRLRRELDEWGDER